MDTLQIPPGTLCVVNALEGTVWMEQSRPRLRWLADVELDAWAATVEAHTYGPRYPNPALRQAGGGAGFTSEDGAVPGLHGVQDRPAAR